MGPTGEVATVVVRCDVGPRLGVGHVMRTLALAEEFALRGYRVCYVADLDSVPFAAEQVRSRGFDHRRPPGDPSDPADPSDPGAECAVIAAESPALVVLDSYLLPPSVYTGVRALAPTVAVIDGDPQGREHGCDLWLDTGIGAETEQWPVPDGVLRLAGLRYALIRSDVLSLRPDHAGPRAESSPVRALAFFGGTDAFGAAPVVTRMVAATGVPVDLTVVAADPDRRAAVHAVALAPGQRVETIEPTPRIAELVRSADVVLSAAGTSSWELLCLGAACGLLCVAGNQEVAYARIVESGAVLGLGYLAERRDDPASEVAELARLLVTPAARERLRRAAGESVDGRGRIRVVDAAERLIHRLDATPRW